MSVDPASRRIGLSLKSIMKEKEAAGDAAEQTEREADVKAAEQLLANRPANPNLPSPQSRTPRSPHRTPRRPHSPANPNQPQPDSLSVCASPCSNRNGCYFGDFLTRLGRQSR